MELLYIHFQSPIQSVWVKSFSEYQHFDEGFRFVLILKTSEMIIILTGTGSPYCISISGVPFSHFWEVVGEAAEMMMMWSSFFYHQLTSFSAHRKCNYCISISGVPFSHFWEVVGEAVEMMMWRQARNLLERDLSLFSMTNIHPCQKCWFILTFRIIRQRKVLTSLKEFIHSKDKWIYVEMLSLGSKKLFYEH